MQRELDEREFLALIRERKSIGYGRMIQIIAHEWATLHPGIGLAHTNRHATKNERENFYSTMAADPLGDGQGWLEAAAKLGGGDGL